MFYSVRILCVATLIRRGWRPRRPAPRDSNVNHNGLTYQSHHVYGRNVSAPTIKRCVRRRGGYHPPAPISSSPNRAHTQVRPYKLTSLSRDVIRRGRRPRRPATTTTTKGKQMKKKELIRLIIEDAKLDMSDEELVHMILERSYSRPENEKKRTFGQIAADNIARFTGSWLFIGCFLFLLMAWMVLNAVLLTSPPDPYPFILLNLILSCIAAIQAPLIMMSQNRKEQHDRARNESDYRVNVKTEIMMADIHEKLDKLLEISR